MKNNPCCAAPALRNLKDCPSPRTSACWIALVFGLLMMPVRGQWAPVTGLPAGFNATDVALAPDGTVFTCGPATNAAESGFYRSTNGGTSWTRLSAGLTYGGSDITPWRIGAFNEVTLAATNGGDGIYRSLNAGSSWTSAGLGPAAAYWDFCRFNADTYFATKRENVVGLSGVWRSLDRGATWTRTSSGIYGLTLPVVGEQIATEAVTLHNGKLYCAVSTTGLFRSTNAGESWTAVNNGLLVDFTPVGPIVNTTDVVSTGTALFASHQAIDAIYRSENDGDSWTNITAGLGSFSDRMAADGGTLYAPMHDGRLFVTSDAGRSWRYHAATGLPGGVQPFIAVKHGVAAYYTTGSGLYKLDLSTAPLVDVAPVITRHPVGGLRLVGQSFTFTAAANGTGPFTYRWRRDGITIQGVTADTLTINPLSTGDAGSYDCVVTGPGGVATSNAVALAVISETPGTLDPLFDTGVPVVNSTTNVNRVLISSTGRLWTGGNYVSRLIDAAAGSTAANRLTTYSGNPLRFSTDGGINGTVNTIIQLANGQMLVGGAFTAAGSPATNTKYLARFNADGTFDNTFIVPATTGTGTVNAMVQDPVTSKIYVAGAFSDWGGDPARDLLVRLNADGTLDGTFSSAAIVSSGQLAALALAPDGKLYVGGNFNGANIGGNTNFNYAFLIRLQTDGTLDTTFPFPIGTLQGRVTSLAALPDGRLIVGSNSGGTGVKNLQRFLSNSQPDPSFVLPGPVSGINTIALQPDGKLLVGGTFTTFAGTAAPGKLVRLLSNGALDTTVTYAQPGTDTSREVTSMTLTANRLYVSQFRGGPAGIRCYFNDLTEPSFSTPPLSQNINAGQPATLRAYVYATQAVTYQWYKDGVLIPGATTDTLSFASLTTGDTGSYTVVVTHPFGPVTSPPAVLRALAAPQVGTPPAAIAQLGNKPLTLAPDVFGQLPLTFQWLKNGNPIANNAPTGGGGNFTGVATAVLNFPGLAESDNGIYTLRVTNSLGTLDIPISVTALPQAGYLPLDYVGPGGLISYVRDAGNDRFFAISTGALSTWNGAAVSAQMLRIRSDNTLDPTFTAPAFTTTAAPPNNVRWADDAQLLANGQVLVWGSFANVSGVSRPGMARLNSNGSLDSSFIANNGTVANGGVSNITRVMELRDGRLLVAGGFTNWGAGPSFAGYTRLVCLDPNGSLNTDFMNALGAAPNSTVTDMDLLPDGRPVLCGGFTSIGGVNRNNMAVLELNGAVSTSFVPPAFTGGGPSDIMALPDGRVLAGGTFTSVTGSSALAGWVVLNANGTRDTTVNTSGTPTIPYPAFGRDANGGIYVVGVQGSGLRRFTGNFVPDPDFLPVENNISGFNGINHIIGLPSGRIVIRTGGTTYQGRPANGTAILRGYPVPLGFITQPLAQSVELGGSVTFSVTPTGTTPVSLQWLKDGVEIPGQTTASLTISGAVRGDSAVYSVRASNVTGGTVTSSGARFTVLAEPVFTAISSSRTVRVGDSVTFSATAIGVAPLQYQWLKNGTNIPGATSATLTLSAVSLTDAATYTCAASNIVNNIAGYTLSPPAHLSVAGGNGGALDAGFTLTSLTGSPAPKVECLLMEPNGQLTIGGSMWFNNNYYYGARYNPDGTRAGSFLTNSGTGAGITSCNGFLYNITRDPQTGNYVAVGTFTLLGGANRTRIGRFTPAFLADTTFDPGTGFTETGAFISGSGLAIDASSRIYVGGNFTTYAGSAVPRVIRLQATGARDTSFTAPAFNNAVSAIFLQGDKLIVGGGFTQVNGAASPPLVRLNSDGTLDATFTSAMTTGSVYEIKAGPAGSLLIAGSGAVSTNNYVHRLNADGTRDTAFNVGSTINGIVSALAPAPDGKVFIAGNFSTVNGQSRPRVAKLNADGTLDPSWIPGTGPAGGTSSVNDLALGPNGTLYLGGDFTSYNGAGRQFIAAVYGDTAPRQIVSLPAPPAAVLGQPLTLGVAATGSAFPAQPYLTYQWLKDNVELPGKTGQTLTLASYSAADEGSYTVRVTDANGSTTSNAVDVAQATGGFSTWASALPAGERDPGDDFDADGIPNLMEYALDLNPLANSAAAMPQPVNNGTHLTYTYRRVRSDIAYSVEAGDNLALPWSTANVNQGTPAGDGTTTASIPLTAPEDFLRLRVTLVP